MGASSNTQPSNQKKSQQQVTFSYGGGAEAGGKEVTRKKKGGSKFEEMKGGGALNISGKEKKSSGFRDGRGRLLTKLGRFSERKKPFSERVRGKSIEDKGKGEGGAQISGEPQQHEPRKYGKNFLKRNTATQLAKVSRAREKKKKKG